MRISIAQINSTIGDFSGNREKILAYSRRAADQGADLVLFPELAVCGYPPMDLLDQDRFVELNIRTVRVLQRELPQNLAVGLGFVNRSPYSRGKSLVNEYGVLLEGKLVFEQIKTLLPTYDGFDEARNFEPGREWSAFEYRGERIGFAICEDVWRETDIPGTSYEKDPVRELLNTGVSILCVPSASPYVAGKLKVRRALAERISLRGNVPLVYINAVGANDQILFDGRSFVAVPGSQSLAPRGGPALAFNEDLVTWDSAAACPNVINDVADEGGGSNQGDDPFGVGLSRYELDILEEGLVMGIRDYMGKCGFKRAHLGLSGGIDSALVAYLGVKAVGADNIVCFSMPSRFSSQGSKDDAAELAATLGCRYEVLPIEPVFQSFLSTLEGVFEKRPFDALGPIGDVFKTEVFALCRRINQRSLEAAGRAIIPQAIIDKPPSAELRPNQKDQDSLPPYEILDTILRLYLYDNLAKDEIAKQGWDGELAGRIIHTVARAEFKRRQAPPVLKVSPRAFGMGRRMPIARAVYEV